jgi:hypothetical protein
MPQLNGGYVKVEPFTKAPTDKSSLAFWMQVNTDTLLLSSPDAAQTHAHTLLLYLALDAVFFVLDT